VRKLIAEEERQQNSMWGKFKNKLGIGNKGTDGAADSDPSTQSDQSQEPAKPQRMEGKS
jgi:hypothetical protein